MRTGRKRGNRGGLLIAVLGLALMMTMFGAMMITSTLEPVKKTASIEDKDVLASVSSGVRKTVSSFPVKGGAIKSDNKRSHYSVEVCDPPVSLIDPDETWIFTGFNETSICRVWSYKTTEDSRTCGQHVLSQLEAIGGTILESGYLDLGRSAWGCAFDPCDGTSLVVTMIPQDLGAEVSSENELHIAVTQYMIGDAA